MKPVVTEPRTLTAEELRTFMTRGFIIVRGGMDIGLAEDWVRHSYDRLALERLGFDGDDPATWGREESGLFLRLDFVAILGVVADVLVQRPVLVVVAEIERHDLRAGRDTEIGVRLADARARGDVAHREGPNAGRARRAHRDVLRGIEAVVRRRWS